VVHTGIEYNRVEKIVSHNYELIELLINDFCLRSNIQLYITTHTRVLFMFLLYISMAGL